jgi:GTP-binding protein
MSNYSAKNIRNIAIIAHVDHGKTTMVDGLVRQNLVIRNVSSLGDLIMDSMDQEKERGITIKAKNASVYHTSGGVEYKINIVDTPGHADFGGEVERALQMVDGACLLVDAQEGPMPQTRYVMRKAIQQGLRIIVIINKVDKPGADCQRTLSRIEDLFLDMGASDLQMDFPVVYAIGVQGKAGSSKENLGEDLTYLLEKVVAEVPAPEVVDSHLKEQLLAEFAPELIDSKANH